MIAKELVSGTIRSTKRNSIAEWCHDAQATFPKQFIINVWCHDKYAYFIPTVPAEDEVTADFTTYEETNEDEIDRESTAI